MPFNSLQSASSDLLILVLSCPLQVRLFNSSGAFNLNIGSQGQLLDTNASARLHKLENWQSFCCM